MKEKVLELLQSVQGELSGEEISRRLGVSRAAVWKAIEQLRQEGCEISASTRRGYRLVFEHPTRKEIMTFQNLPCGSIWNCYAEELTDMAIRFNNSAEAILNPDIPDNGGIEP